MDEWLSRAVDRARQLNATEIVVAAAWKQKRMRNGRTVASHSLPVKFLPDAAIRVYNSTARFELWPISYVRIKNQGNEDQNLE
jgi:hypothetical protein